MTKQIRNIVPKLEEYLKQPELTEEQAVWLKVVVNELDQQVRENGLSIKDVRGYALDGTQNPIVQMQTTGYFAKILECGEGSQTLYVVPSNGHFCCGNEFLEILHRGVRFFNTRKKYFPLEAASGVQAARKSVESLVKSLEEIIGPNSYHAEWISPKKYGEICQETQREIIRVFESLSEDKFTRSVLDEEIKFEGKNIVLISGGDVTREKFVSTVRSDLELATEYHKNNSDTLQLTLIEYIRAKRQEVGTDCTTRLETINRLLFRHGANSVYTINPQEDYCTLYQVSQSGENKYETKKIEVKKNEK